MRRFQHLSFTIEGQTPTKKSTHKSKWSRKHKRFIIASSQEYLQWEEAAVLQLLNQKNQMGLDTITEPVWCVFKIYRYGNAQVDLSNLYQSLEDALEKATVLKKDFLISSHDGSRRFLGVPRDSERAEIEIKKFWK